MMKIKNYQLVSMFCITLLIMSGIVFAGEQQGLVVQLDGIADGDGWQGVALFCKEPIPVDGPLSTVGAWVKPGTGNSKLLIIVKDKNDELYSVRVVSRARDHGPAGKAHEQSAGEFGPIGAISVQRLLYIGRNSAPAPAPGQSVPELLGARPATGKKPVSPVSLVGIIVIEINPLKQTDVVEIRDVKINGKVIEDFSSNKRGWFIPNQGAPFYAKHRPGLKVTVGGQKPAHVPFPEASEDNRLKLIMAIPETWYPLTIGPEKPLSFPRVPRKVGVYITGESTGAVKVYVVLKDANGIEHDALLTMYLRGGEKGAYMEVDLSKAKSYGGEIAASGIWEPPVTFHGITFICRKPLIETDIYVDNVTLDGTVVEDFSEDHGWHIIEKSPATTCEISMASKDLPVDLAENFPARTENLIANPYIEENDKGWHHGEQEYIPKDSAGKPVADMNDHGGMYARENIGSESFHSMAMSAPAGKWAGLDTMLTGIKSNTTYVLTFCYRMPRRGSFSLCLFGRRIFLKDMWTENPGRWIRFTKAFNSGSVAGDVPMGFHIYPQDKSTKVWIDEVEMYEGFSPIGYEQARLHHYYYNHTWVSPDVALPMLFQMEMIFSDANVPETLDYVLELPEEVIPAGNFASLSRWSQTGPLKDFTKTPVEVDGKKLIRYTITLPFATANPRFRRYFTRVPRRDVWSSGGLGNYSGGHSCVVFLGTDKTQGEFTGYYYARWSASAGRPACEQPKRKFLMKVTRVPKVEPFKRFKAIVGLGFRYINACPRFAEDLARMGFNGIGITGREGIISKAEKEKLRKLGIHYFWWWWNSPAFFGTDPAAGAVGLDGRREDPKTGRAERCLSFRGPDITKAMNKAKQAIKDCHVNIITYDDAKPCTCYCDQCIALFKEFMKQYSELPFKDPREFMGPGANPDPRYVKLWEEFPLWHYGMAAKDVREELQTYCRENDRDVIQLASSSFPPSSSEPLFAFDGCRKGFDFVTGQYYLNWGHAWTKGSPRRMAEGPPRLYGMMGEYTVPIVPNLGPGIGYENPFLALDPPETMKYQLLETAMAIPMAGYNMYAGGDIDAGDFKYMAEFNEMIRSYEELIIDGKVISGATCKGPDSGVRVKELKGKRLVLVSDYSTYGDEPTEVEVTLPFAGPLALKDVQTGKVAARLKAGEKTFKITLKGERARLFACE